MTLNQVNRFTFVNNPNDETDNFKYLEWNDKFLLIGFDPSIIITLEQLHDIKAIPEVVIMMVQDLIETEVIEQVEAPLTQTVLEQMVTDIVNERKLNVDVCDRTKVEILARELCMEFYGGKRSVTKERNDIRNFTETNWREWENIAIQLLETLEKHK